MTPRVSIITPVYNARKYLPATWRSIRRQTFTDWEWVVSDDGSTDGSREWLEKLAARDDRVHLTDGPPGGRPSVPRNRSMRAARGEFLALLDADDLWHRRKLQRQVEHLDRHPDVGITWSWVREFLDTTAGDTSLPPLVWPRVTNPPDPLHHLLSVGLSFCTSSWMIRRETITRVGPLNESLPAHDDLEFMIRAAMKIRIDRTSGVLVAYRITPDAISSRPNPEKVLRLHEALLELDLSDHPAWKTYLANHHLKLAEHAMAGVYPASPRRHLVRSLLANPMIPKRWPLIPLLLLPSAWIPAVYQRMKQGQKALLPGKTTAHHMVDGWGKK